MTGSTGKPLTLDSLPPADTKRWVIGRKAEVVTAVRDGLIDLDEACERYRLSVEEFLNWERLIESHGLRGLRSTLTRSTGGPPREPQNDLQRLYFSRRQHCPEPPRNEGAYDRIRMA